MVWMYGWASLCGTQRDRKDKFCVIVNPSLGVSVLLSIRFLCLPVDLNVILVIKTLYAQKLSKIFE